MRQTVVCSCILAVEHSCYIGLMEKMAHWDIEDRCVAKVLVSPKGT
jgi:hypothetical protein